MSLATTCRAATLLLAAPLALAGCGAGLSAQTYQPRDAGNAANVDVRDLAVRNAYVEAPAGAAGDPAGSDARIVLTLVNQGGTDDQLVAAGTDAAGSVGPSVDVAGRTDVTAGASPGASVAPTGGAAATSPGAVSPGQAGSSATGSSPTGSSATGSPAAAVPAGGSAQVVLLLHGLTRPLRSGEYLTLHLQFAVNGSADISVPVAVATGTAASQAPAPTGSASPG